MVFLAQCPVGSFDIFVGSMFVDSKKLELVSIGKIRMVECCTYFVEIFRTYCELQHAQQHEQSRREPHVFAFDAPEREIETFKRID